MANIKVGCRQSLVALMVGAMTLGLFGEDIILSGTEVRTLEPAESLAIDNGTRNISVSDSASIVVPSRSTSYITLFGTGETVFSGNSSLDLGSLSGIINIGSTIRGMDSQCYLEFRDHARIASSSYAYPTGIRFYNTKRDTFTHVVYNSDATSSLGARTFIGYSNGGDSFKGNCQFDIKNGYLQSGGNYGLMLGYNANTLNSTFVATGIVTIAGGCLTSKGNLGGSTSGNNQLLGTIIGRGPSTDVDSRIAYGSLEISGGVFTNLCGYFVTGMGRGFGRVLQTGGEIHSTPSYDRKAVVGFAGGDGEYTVSNGVSRFFSDLFIGGATTEMVNSSDYNPHRDNTDSGADYTRTGSGRLVVASADAEKPCSLELVKNNYCNGKLWVGQNGTGSVEVAENSIVICQQAEFCTNSTLKFNLGRTGALETDHAISLALLRVKGEMVVWSGSKLVVDARDYSANVAWVRLVRPNTRNGSFAAENITLLGDGEIVQDRPGYSDGSIWYHRPVGMIFIFR